MGPCRERPDVRWELEAAIGAMSRKNELKADLKRIGYQLGGAHLTREARSATFNTFANVLSELGYGIQAARQIGGKHLQAFQPMLHNEHRRVTDSAGPAIKVKD